MRTTLVAGFLLFTGAALQAQTTAQQRRSDGALTPLMVYGSAMQGNSCAPLALISHGAGGSERGYVYLAQGLAARGWFAVVMGHKESGMAAIQADIQSAPTRHDGVQQLVTTPAANEARLMDVGAGLAWANAQCKVSGGIPFRALLGHSMGGETVMLEAGAKNKLGVAPGKDRFDAYVAMSSEGPGPIFTQDSWRGLRKPVFVLTGTLDGALNGGPETRLAPYAGLPGASGCDWLGVITGATHSSFGGRGPNAAVVNLEIVAAIDSFLQGARAGKCVLPAKVAGFRLESK
jgi:predicted dienelactone hydrolase